MRACLDWTHEVEVVTQTSCLAGLPSLLAQLLPEPLELLVHGLTAVVVVIVCVCCLYGPLRS